MSVAAAAGGEYDDIYPSAWARPSTYRYIALTPAGLAVGVGHVGVCGSVKVTVRYSVPRPYLSKLGAKLVAGVRWPHH